MNKKAVYLVIVLMSLAVLILFGIQYYWMQNAITLREASFSGGVEKAMTNVIYKLEKLDVADRIRSRMHRSRQGRKILNKIDSINNLFAKDIESNGKQIYNDDSSGINKNIFNVGDEKINVFVLQERTGDNIKSFDTTVVTIQKRLPSQNMKSTIYSEIPSISYGIDSVLSKDYQVVERNISQYLNKTFLVNDVFDDLFKFKYYDAIENRLNFILLDSLIKIELRKGGVYTDYEFGVYSPMRNIMVIEKTGHFHKNLLEEGYAFNMFPRDLIMTPEFLMIYFPNKKAYLFFQMWKMIVISILLILIISLSFIYTIVTIFKQKKLSEMKNDFINNMTHEFKTPISTISLACEMLGDSEVEKSEKIHDNYVKVITEENKRLGSMAEKILQTAIIDKGQLKLHKELINLHQIIEDVIASIHIQVDVKDGKIVSELNARNYYIKADNTHITNLIYNVIDNAIKYTPEKPLIKVNTQSNQKGILLTISDNGIGISKTNQKKIFEKLFRVSTGNVHNVKGFGLGLHYVKTIVDKHEGNITVESELKKGTTIKIFLPFNSKE